MIRLLHLLDASARWEHRVALAQLLERLPHSEFRQSVAVVDGSARQALGPWGRDAPLFARRLGADFTAAPALRRFLQHAGVDLVHAWGLRAAAVAEHAHDPDSCPIALTLFDSALDDRQANFLRAVRCPHRKPILGSCQTVRRRLLEKGIEADRCVVLRPGVDFGQINRARQSDLRSRLGLTPQHCVVVTPEPVTPRGGHFAAFWATAIRSFLDPDVRLVLPGESREQQRLARLARRLGMPHLVRCPGTGVPFEALVTAGDVFMAAPTEDAPTTALAWAMAAGVPIIATAVHSVAELLAHNLNALLLKPAEPKRLATCLARALGERDAFRRMADAARGHAYELFSLHRSIDQHSRLYRNLLDARPPADGIADSAMPA